MRTDSTMTLDDRLDTTDRTTADNHQTTIEMTTKAILETVVIVAVLIVLKQMNGMIHGIDPGSRVLEREAMSKDGIALEATALQTQTLDQDLVPPTPVEVHALTQAEVLVQG